MKVLALLLLVVVAGLASSSPASAQDRVEEFRIPDVRDDFCGVNISFQYCRCAFHDEEVYCRAVEMNQSGARSHVSSSFQEWVGDLIETFAANCIRNNGDWNRSRRTCTYPGPDEPQTIQERYRLPDMTGRPRSANSGRAIGKVVAASNCNVFVYMASFDRWKGPVRGGQDIYQDDVLITREQDGCSGEARVTLYSESGQDTIDIATETWLEFPKPVDPAETGILADLKRGAIHLYDFITGNLQPEFRSPFNVRTPTISTGRRGTEFFISHNDETNVSEVLVIEGEVDVTPVGAGQTTMLAANQGATHQDGSLTTHEVSSNDWDDALDSRGLSGDHITVAAEDLVRPDGPPVEFTRAELVGDLSFLDDQFGGSGLPAKGIFVGLLIVGIVAMMAGVAIIAPMLLLPPKSRLRR